MRRSPLAYAAALAVMLAAALLFWRDAAAAEDAGLELGATLLTRELGDPRAPGNVKVAVALPEVVLAGGSSIEAEDFRVYVHPAELSREEGMQARYLAEGVYLWRNGDDVFLDARVVPARENEGLATVRIAYAPGGRVLAEGVADGYSRYAGEFADVVLAVDVSLSMNYKDPKKRRVHAARTFIEMARRGGGIGRVGLVTFNHKAKLKTGLVPLEEGEVLLANLRRVGAVGLTNLDRALELSMRELDGSRNPVVILLTDGKNEGTDYADTHLRAAGEGVRIFTVGLSEKADHALLREMADATGGRYYEAVKDSDLPDIYARIAAELGKRRLIRSFRIANAEGAEDIPVDATVRRMVAVADGGARIAASGPGMEARTPGSLSSAHVDAPRAGVWSVSWRDAVPGASTLSLSGDTPFFLDLFPPRIMDGRLSVGATLAMGKRALGDAVVRVDPVPGLIPDGLRLYDDGLHGDGAAGDGVYAGGIDLDDSPERLGVTVRAEGSAWDFGAFVRQAEDAAVRVLKPVPPSVARLDGDIDFGVLFPGETGTAIASLDLDAPEPRELIMELSWDSDGDLWPSLSSMAMVEPGARKFELEMTVPETAAPGLYAGRFYAGDGGDLSDESDARVKVGTVHFRHGGEMDLGVVPPGTFLARTARVAYEADKEALLSVEVAGDGAMEVAADRDRLAAGAGELELDIVVSAPIGTEKGVYRGRVLLSAGPGSTVLPVKWEVRPLTAAAGKIEPLPGLPAPPSLPTDTAPLESAGDFRPDLWRPEIVPSSEPGEGTAESPWEKTSRALRGKAAEPAEAVTAPSGDGFRFPEIGATDPDGDEDSFWSAWWIYLLAALLLLLLLLLLLAYILYRLGKSRLARMLLLSAAANIVLLILFIILLGAAETAISGPRTITVSLVDEEYPEYVELSESEQQMLGASGPAGASSGGGSTPGPEDISLADAASSGGGMHLEKPDGTQADAEMDLELADAASASAEPLESRERESLQRRERRRERVEQPVPESVELNEAMDDAALAEMAEPPHENERREAGIPEVSETRMDIEAAHQSDRPVWSDGAKPIQPPASEQGALLALAPGSESVELDRSVRSIDPRGRKRNVQELPDAYPEPRVDIADPARDAMEHAAPDASAQPDDDPGVEEIRAEPVAVGTDIAGKKPGTVIPPGASLLTDSRPDDLPRGMPGNDAPSAALARGGDRFARGGAARGGAELPEPGGAGVPGGSGSASRRPSSSGGAGKKQAGGAGEMRFDDAPGGGRLAGDGQSKRFGTLRQPGAIAGGGPSPSASGGARPGERLTFSPGNGGTAGKLDGDSRSDRPGRRNGSDVGEPGGQDKIPGGLAGKGPNGGMTGDRPTPGNGGGRRGAGSGVGEGRFDDMARGAGTGDGRHRTGADLPGPGSSRLTGGDGTGGLELLPLDVAESDWKRNARRDRRRTVNLAASSVDMDSLVIVVGDFNAFADGASAKLFSKLSGRLGSGLAVEERILSPQGGNLADTLLALLTPEAADGWSDADYDRVAAYLKAGGHIWLDARDREQAAPVLRRLASHAGGDVAPLPARHQLARDEAVDAILLADPEKPALVATYLNWRGAWRRERVDDAGALRFLIRGLNYFLSGDADTGIVLDPEELDGGLFVEPSAQTIPELLSGNGPDQGRVWDELDGDAVSSWKIPSWSDKGALSVISDGQGGRALKIDLSGAAKGRSALYRTLSPAQDFSGVERVTLEAYYDGEGEATLSMVFTVPGPKGWMDFETPAAPLSPGWNRLEFEVGRNNFRSLSDGGGVVVSMPGTDRVARAGFFIYRDGEAPAVALFRDIRLHGK